MYCTMAQPLFREKSPGFPCRLKKISPFVCASFSPSGLLFLKLQSFFSPHILDFLSLQFFLYFLYPVLPGPSSLAFVSLYTVLPFLPVRPFFISSICLYRPSHQISFPPSILTFIPSLHPDLHSLHSDLHSLPPF